jgi:serine/threonine protein phosphatase PrpC
MIIASDGLWEFLENEIVKRLINIKIVETVGKMLSQGSNTKSICEYLYDESQKKWIDEEGVIDDITIILALLK